MNYEASLSSSLSLSFSPEGEKRLLPSRRFLMAVAAAAAAAAAVAVEQRGRRK